MAEVRFDPAALVARPVWELRHKYDQRDTILYALGVGAGQGVDGMPELRYVYEQGLAALPTMAVVLAYPGFWQQNPEYGIDWTKVLHGEQSVVFHRPLPVSGEVIGRFRIRSVHDKGEGKGSLLYAEREIVDAATGESLATVVQGSFLRGNGGAGSVAEGPPPAPHQLPADRAPDHVVTLHSHGDQAVIYRLSGDYNPLHIDPAVAAKAGFDRPILHGLCTYGMAGRAVIAAFCGGDESRLRRFDVRFSSPVFPGETIRFDLWNEGPGKGSCRATVVGREVQVLNNGYVEYD